MINTKKRNTIMVSVLTILMMVISTYILSTKDIKMKEQLFLIIAINIVGTFIYIYIYNLKDEVKKVFLSKVSYRMCNFSFSMLFLLANLMINEYTFFYTLLVLTSGTISLITNKYIEIKEEVINVQINDDIQRRINKVDYLYLFMAVALHFIIVILYFIFIQSQNDGYIAEFIIICSASIISITAFIYSFIIQNIKIKAKMFIISKYSLFVGAITAMIFMTTYNSIIFILIAGIFIAYSFLFIIIGLSIENINKRCPKVNI